MSEEPKKVVRRGLPRPTQAPVDKDPAASQQNVGSTAKEGSEESTPTPAKPTRRSGLPRTSSSPTSSPSKTESARAQAPQPESPKPEQPAAASEEPKRTAPTRRRGLGDRSTPAPATESKAQSAPVPAFENNDVEAIKTEDSTPAGTENNRTGDHNGPRKNIGALKQTSPASASTQRPASPTPAPQTPARPSPKGARKSARGPQIRALCMSAIGILILLGILVAIARWLVSLESVREFLSAYPGIYSLPSWAPHGIPGWLGWQHFFNVFLIVLIIRAGLQVRYQKKPPLMWTGRGKKAQKISINLWLHQVLDLLWVINGVIFVTLLFSTGQWVRIIPTSWSVFPNAGSALLQYLSLHWPAENGWANYNSLQQLTYFVTVFLAAPLAIVSGIRLSHLWPQQPRWLSKAYPIEVARKIHLPVMLYFVCFIVVHVALVLATGALRNLNHMYGAQDAVNWTGFWIFFASLVIIAAAWIAVRPLLLAPVARLFGTVSKR